MLDSIFFLVVTKKISTLKTAKSIQSKPTKIGLDWIGLQSDYHPIQTEPQKILVIGSDDFLVQNRSKPHREHP